MAIVFRAAAMMALRDDTFADAVCSNRGLMIPNPRDANVVDRFSHGELGTTALLASVCSWCLFFTAVPRPTNRRRKPCPRRMFLLPSVLALRWLLL